MEGPLNDILNFSWQQKTYIIVWEKNATFFKRRISEFAFAKCGFRNFKVKF